MLARIKQGVLALRSKWRQRRSTMLKGQNYDMGFTWGERVSIDAALEAFRLKLEAVLMQHPCGIGRQTEKGKEAFQAMQTCLTECEQALKEAIESQLSATFDEKSIKITARKEREIKEWKERLLRHGYDVIISGIIKSHNYQLMNVLSSVHTQHNRSADVSPKRIEEEVKGDLDKIWKNIHFDAQTLQTAINASRGSKRFHQRQMVFCQNYLHTSRVLAERGVAFGRTNQALIDVLVDDKAKPDFLSRVKKRIQHWLAADKQLRQAERDYEVDCKKLGKAKIECLGVKKRHIGKSIDALVSLSKQRWFSSPLPAAIETEDCLPNSEGEELKKNLPRSYWVSLMLKRLIFHYFPKNEKRKARTQERVTRYAPTYPTLSDNNPLINVPRNEEESLIIILPPADRPNQLSLYPSSQAMIPPKKIKRRGKNLEVSVISDKNGHEESLTRVSPPDRQPFLDDMLANLDPTLQGVAQQLVRNVEQTIQLYDYIHNDLTPRIEAVGQALFEAKAEQAELKADNKKIKADNKELKADNKELKEKCKALERDSRQQHAEMEEKLRQQRAEIDRAKEQERIEINEKLKQMMSQIEALQKESVSQKQAKNASGDAPRVVYEKEETSDNEQRSQYRLFQSH